MGMVKIGDSLTMDEDRRNHFLKIHDSSNEEFEAECKNWTAADWIDYYKSTEGAMTLDEFCDKLIKGI